MSYRAIGIVVGNKAKYWFYRGYIPIHKRILVTPTPKLEPYDYDGYRVLFWGLGLSKATYCRIPY